MTCSYKTALCLLHQSTTSCTQFVQCIWLNNLKGIYIYIYHLKLQPFGKHRWKINTSVIYTSHQMKRVSANPAQTMCTRHNIMWSSLSATCDRSVVFSVYSGFLQQYNWPPQYSWNIVETFVQHHSSQMNIYTNQFTYILLIYDNYVNIWDISVQINVWYYRFSCNTVVASY